MKPEKLDVAALRAMGRRADWDAAQPFAPTPGAARDADGRPSPDSEDELALEFTRRHGEDWRYVAPWGKWLVWTGSKWQVEPTLRVFDLAREVCRETGEFLGERHRRRNATAQTRNAVVSLAQADRTHAATVDQWDRDPWLLGTPAGVVDLKTGTIREHQRDDYITKNTMMSPADMATPTWDGFLRRVTGGDHELAAFLQRHAGYSLTGLTREHVVLFLYGTGANGKSTYTSTLSRVLGDYATVAPMETFIAGPAERHPTDLAALRGARLVTAQETEDGRRWAESKLKNLTGGDPIAARFMRQDFFTFTPQFKLLLCGNHKPSLRNVDEAMRRRFNLVPFTEFIGAEERDPQLAEKLMAEGPGILAWAIRGCTAWQSVGLLPPERVTTATSDYFEAEDAVARWLEDRCDVGDQYEDTNERLFESWRSWADASQEYAGSKKRFTQRLEERGCRPGWVASVRGMRGLRVRR